MKLRVLVLHILIATTVTAIAVAQEKRQWTNTEGKEIFASFVSADETSVTLKLENGRKASIPLNRLNQRDRQYIAELDKQGLAFSVREMPGETSAERQIAVEGGPRVFKTPNFVFETDQDVTKAFISEAAKVYEGTFVAIQSLPLGLELSPPEGMNRFRGVFMNDSAFKLEFGESDSPHANTRVAGVYAPNKKALFVPYASLGAKRNGSQITLRRTSDTSTLIHEITHQVMHEWLPFIPIWMAEGMAEYISAVPYQNGRFEFKNSERGLKERLEAKYKFSTGFPLTNQKKWPQVYRPSDLIFRSGKSDTREWDGNLDEYRDSLLLFYYFIHLDRKEAQGAPIAAYLKLVDRAKNETDQFIAEYNAEVEAFEKKRKAYNDAVKRFNAELEVYRKQVNAYNAVIEVYNRQTEEGMPESERVKISDPPTEPVPPEKLELPKILKETEKSGPLDIVAIIRERATHALLRGRSPEQLDADVKKAYSEIGIAIQY